MKKIHIITPVKDSIELTLKTIEAITHSQFRIPYTYTVYNDFSTPENSAILDKAAQQYGFNLVHLSDLTQNPSPNYLFVLQLSQEKALKEDAGLCIVESDVVVHPDTLQRLFDEAQQRPDCGIAAAVTVDDKGLINYPYLYAKGEENKVFTTRKHLSFCCSLLTTAFMQKFNFQRLDPSKSWHDVTISHESLKQGFNNYLCTTLPVFHQPHGSRPWKQLKYSNPLKYYWLKLIHRRDKI
ncbi:glycosyltransferase family A protein [Parabacteroides sp. PF5-9]|uniref:glycosyltransferase family A protein n=1 Tax=Parabacteroides sp. PF5-9 TaxID=1742404 RepID=UPI0024743E05|nr:glycosyltransferase family A protein [Parabacteroides sp. PF5-9]